MQESTSSVKSDKCKRVDFSDEYDFCDPWIAQLLNQVSDNGSISPLYPREERSTNEIVNGTNFLLVFMEKTGRKKKCKNVKKKPFLVTVKELKSNRTACNSSEPIGEQSADLRVKNVPCEPMSNKNKFKEENIDLGKCTCNLKRNKDQYPDELNKIIEPMIDLRKCACHSKRNKDRNNEKNGALDFPYIHYDRTIRKEMVPGRRKKSQQFQDKITPKSSFRNSGMMQNGCNVCPDCKCNIESFNERKHSSGDKTETYKDFKVFRQNCESHPASLDIFNGHLSSSMKNETLPKKTAFFRNSPKCRHKLKEIDKTSLNNKKHDSNPMISTLDAGKSATETSPFFHMFEHSFESLVPPASSDIVLFGHHPHSVALTERERLELEEEHMIPFPLCEHIAEKQYSQTQRHASTQT